MKRRRLGDQSHRVTGKPLRVMSRRRNGPNPRDTNRLHNAPSQFAMILLLVLILPHSDLNQRLRDLSRRRNGPIRHHTEQNRRDLNVIGRQELKPNP